MKATPNESELLSHNARRIKKGQCLQRSDTRVAWDSKLERGGCATSVAHGARGMKTVQFNSEMGGGLTQGKYKHRLSKDSEI
jgi:hypothetical protein